MGIKGTVRRSTDGHIIHANVDTDIIISEDPEYGTFLRNFRLFTTYAPKSTGGTVDLGPTILFVLITDFCA